VPKVRNDDLCRPWPLTSEPKINRLRKVSRTTSVPSFKSLRSGFFRFILLTYTHIATKWSLYLRRRSYVAGVDNKPPAFKCETVWYYWRACREHHTVPESPPPTTTTSAPPRNENRSWRCCAVRPAHPRSPAAAGPSVRLDGPAARWRRCYDDYGRGEEADHDDDDDVCAGIGRRRGARTGRRRSSVLNYFIDASVSTTLCAVSCRFRRPTNVRPVADPGGDLAMPQPVCQWDLGPEFCTGWWALGSLWYISG